MQIFLVTREKKNGNIIVGFYLIDMYCLGLKNTFYLELSGITELENTFLNHARDTYEELDDSYVFNCIYGAIEYAEDCGISPHDNFKITEYILDDVEEIDFIEIEFGLNGRPFLVPSPNDDTLKLLKILNETIGPENYDYMSQSEFQKNEADDEGDFEDPWWGNEEESLNYLNELSQEERDNLFAETLMDLPEDIHEIYSQIRFIAPAFEHKMNIEECLAYETAYINAPEV